MKFFFAEKKGDILELPLTFDSWFWDEFIDDICRETFFDHFYP